MIQESVSLFLRLEEDGRQFRKSHLASDDTIYSLVYANGTARCGLLTKHNTIYSSSDDPETIYKLDGLLQLVL